MITEIEFNPYAKLITVRSTTGVRQYRQTGRRMNRLWPKIEHWAFCQQFGRVNMVRPIGVIPNGAFAQAGSFDSLNIGGGK